MDQTQNIPNPDPNANSDSDIEPRANPEADSPQKTPTIVDSISLQPNTSHQQEKPNVDASNHSNHVHRDTRIPTTRHILESLGLSIIFNFLGRIFKWNVEEEKKTIMDRSSKLAVIRCLVHMIPAAACGVLVGLNARAWYIGSELQGVEGEDTEKLGGLQFAAKLHELFMLSSLGVILITHIRKELAFGDGIPLGALFSSNQFQSINILWSLEFWGVIYHHWEKRRSKTFIVSLIVLCSFLGLSVGPSSANTMRPRLDYWPVGGTAFWINSTNSTLFPNHLEDSPALLHCLQDNGDLSCPYGEWQILNSSLFSYPSYSTGTYSSPLTIDFQTSISRRAMQLRSRFQYPQKLLRNTYTSATIPYSFIADSIFRLAQLWNQATLVVPTNLLYRLDNAFMVSVYQPVVISRCLSYPMQGNATSKLAFPIINSTIWHEDDPIQEEFYNPDIAADFNLLDTQVNAALKSATNGSAKSSLYWLDTPQLLEMTNSSLNAVAVVPKTANFGPSYYCCSIQIRSLNASVSSGESTTSNIVGTANRWAEYSIYTPQIPYIFPQAAWARYVNPMVKNTNSTVFSNLVSTASQWNWTQSSMVKYPEISIEVILTTLIANGLGRCNYYASMLSDNFLFRTPSDNAAWVRKILPKNLNIGSGDNAFDIPDSLQRNSTRFQFQVTNYGYAYSSSGMVQKAALAVLLAYVALVIAHSVMSIYTGLSSSSWGSPSEIAALAMNSAPSGELHNTGAGIQTVAVYEKNVQLDLEEGNVFIAIQKKREHTLEPNTSYG